MTDQLKYLSAYDEQLRADTEMASAVRVEVTGPVRLVTFAGGRGFVTYRDLGSFDTGGVGKLATRARSFLPPFCIAPHSA